MSGPPGEQGRPPVDLATTPPFRLGDLEIRPSTRQVIGPCGGEALAEPKALQVLITLVEADGAVVSRDALIRRCWGGRIVGEDAINRSIAKVRQLAELTDPPAFAIETIPRVGYRLRDGSGAPAEDMAPAGAPVSEDRTAPRSRGRLAVLLAGTAILLAGGVMAVVWLRSHPPGRLIAVEPLRAAAADAPAQAVRLGLSGDLAHALMGNPAGLTVDQPGLRGARASADLVLSGDVATIGDRLQAHVQLSSGGRGAILWASDFAGDATHPEVLREQIATKADAVVDCALSERHTGGAKIGDEANRLYLKACDLIEQYRLDDALVPLQQLTALQPRFARAWADLATTQALTARGAGPERQAEVFREAAANARRALALDPKTGLAYYALAVALPGIGEWSRRVDILAQGLAAEPDGSELNNAMASELQRVGRSSEAIGYFRRSMAADPLNPVKTAALFRALAFAGQMDEAELLVRKALRLWPRNPVIWNSAFGVELYVGDPKTAESMLAERDRPGLLDANEQAVARLWLEARRNPTAANITAALAPRLDTASASPRKDPLGAAVSLAQFGRVDAAYNLALNSTADADEALDSLLFQHPLAKFRADPRFMTLAARRGLVSIWRATGRWPDFCADQAASNGCPATAAPVSH